MAKSKVVKFSPAGKDENIKVVGMDINTIIEKEKFVLKAAERGVEILSTDLTENLSIKAHDGYPVQNNSNTVNFEAKKAQIESRKKTTDINEYKKSKQKDEGREIG